MAVICDHTTRVPYSDPMADTCKELRQLYFRYNMAGPDGQGLGELNCAAIFYRRVARGTLCHVTNSAESGVGADNSAEKVCYDELIAREGDMPPIIEYVYTERCPCGTGNKDRLEFLDKTMPGGTSVFWSFE